MIDLCDVMTLMSHGKEMISELLALCEGNPLVTSNFSHNRPVIQNSSPTTRIWFLNYWPFVRGIHWSPVDSPHKGPVMWNYISSEHAVKQTTQLKVIFDAMTPMKCHDDVRDHDSHVKSL